MTVDGLRASNQLVRKPSKEPERSGRRVVLIADDEPLLARLLETVIQKAGYGTLLCADGVEAVEAWALHREEIALAVLDMGMPRMGGIACLDVMRAARPDLPAVVMSGYDLLDETSRLRVPGQVYLVQKPFRAHMLVDLIDEILRKRAS